MRQLSIVLASFGLLIGSSTLAEACWRSHPYCCYCPPAPCLDFTYKLHGEHKIKVGDNDPKFRIELHNLSCIEWGFYSNEIKFSLWDENGVEIPGAFVYPTVLRLILMPPSGTITIDPGVTLTPGLKKGIYTVKLSILLKTTTFALEVI